MNCPKCSQSMTVSRSDVSNNPDTGAAYDRTVYVCQTDDVWVVTEIPKS